MEIQNYKKYLSKLSKYSSNRKNRPNYVQSSTKIYLNNFLKLEISKIGKRKSNIIVSLFF